MFVGNEAFPLKPCLIRPWPSRMLTNQPRKVFNYGVSRVFRVIENPFGFIFAKWRLLHIKIIADKETTISLVRSMCLPSFLRTAADFSSAPTGYCDTVQAV